MLTAINVGQIIRDRIKKDTAKLNIAEPDPIPKSKDNEEMLERINIFKELLYIEPNEKQIMKTNANKATLGFHDVMVDEATEYALDGEKNYVKLRNTKFIGNKLLKTDYWKRAEKAVNTFNAYINDTLKVAIFKSQFDGWIITSLSSYKRVVKFEDLNNQIWRCIQGGDTFPGFILNKLYFSTKDRLYDHAGERLSANIYNDHADKKPQNIKKLKFKRIR